VATTAAITRRRTPGAACGECVEEWGRFTAL
jgi:hypothetical protein